MSKPNQGPMFSQLNSLRRQIKPPRRDNVKDPSPSPMLWKGDGEDHINIWERAETELGCILSHNSKLPFNHSVFGRFGNMEAFWHYIQSEERDDRIRMMGGQTLKNFSRKLTMTRVGNFRAIIMDGNYQRIKQYEPIVSAITESTLPFDCYYVSPETQLRTRPIFFKWLMMGFEQIRQAIKEKREPNFEFLLDRPGTSIYQFALPQLPVVEKTEPKATKPKPEPRAKTSSLLVRVNEIAVAADNQDRAKDPHEQVDHAPVVESQPEVVLQETQATPG